MTEELYDKLVSILDEYDETTKTESRNWEEEFYDLLVEIQNHAIIHYNKQ